MGKKPTYEDLEQRVKELEEKVVKGKRSEEALRESDEKYRTVLESSPDPVVVSRSRITVRAWMRKQKAGYLNRFLQQSSRVVEWAWPLCMA